MLECVDVDDLPVHVNLWNGLEDVCIEPRFQLFPQFNIHQLVFVLKVVNDYESRSVVLEEDSTNLLTSTAREANVS